VVDVVVGSPFVVGAVVVVDPPFDPRVVVVVVVEVDVEVVEVEVTGDDPLVVLVDDDDGAVDVVVDGDGAVVVVVVLVVGDGVTLVQPGQK
jgi:hypothetical protein